MGVLASRTRNRQALELEAGELWKNVTVYLPQKRFRQ